MTLLNRIVVMVVGLGLVIVGIYVATEPLRMLKKERPPSSEPDQPTALASDEFLKELIKKLPWMAILGLLLVYAGLVALGVEFW